MKWVWEPISVQLQDWVRDGNLLVALVDDLRRYFDRGRMSLLILRDLSVP